MSADKYGPDDLARTMQEHAQRRKAAAEALAAYPQVQRLAANKEPAELKKQIEQRLHALMAQHTATIHLLSGKIEQALEDPDADKEDIADIAAASGFHNANRGQLLGLSFSLKHINCEFPAPPPEAIDEAVFDRLDCNGEGEGEGEA